MKRSAPLAPSRKGLARTAPLPSRRSLPPAQRRAYAVARPDKAGECFSCGRWAALDPSHILPQGMNQHHKANPANIVGECRACHDLWGLNLSEYARRFPLALAAKVERMQQVDRGRWAVWMMKNSHLLP